MRLDRYLEYSKEVKDALMADKAVVALESSTLAHVLPYPRSFEMAKGIRERIREEGAVPATIAIIKGRIKVGLSEEDIELLSQSTKGGQVKKANRKDLFMLLAKEEDGATTAGAAMVLANLGKIKVFVAGGIGGVYENEDESCHISSDLEELSKTNIAVISSGFLPQMNIKKSLEYMDTKGIPVVGYRTLKLPNYYLGYTDEVVDYSVDNEEELAKALQFKWALGLGGGLMVTQGISKEHQLEENAPKGKNQIYKSIMNLTYENAVLGAKLAKKIRVNP